MDHPRLPPTLFQGIREGAVLYRPRTKRLVFSGPSGVYDYLRDPLADLDCEVFLALLLNTRNVLTRVFVVSVGSVNASIVHPREVFRPAIRFSATSILVAHNHPSGEPDPSEDDLCITRRLVQAGEVIGISVLDHIIVAKNGYVSLKEAGHL